MRSRRAVANTATTTPEGRAQSRCVGAYPGRSIGDPPAIVDQAAIAVSQLDTDVRALAAGTIVAFAVQDDVVATIAICQTDAARTAG